MIRFGPAGIPLSCKGRTLQDGIEDVHNLSLSALEVQMVRPMTHLITPDDEEIGNGFRDIESRDVEEGFAISILRNDEVICDPDEPIDEDDYIIMLQSDIVKKYSEFAAIGKRAKWLDVNLSIHTPYYMDLGSDAALTETCLQSVQNTALVLNALDGDIVVTSLGIYDDERRNRKEIDEMIYDNVEYLTEWWEDNNIKPRFGVEVTGQQGVFGSLDQIFDLCKEFPSITPVMNFSHYYSRTNGALKEVDDFREVLDDIRKHCKGRIHTAFAGVEYEDGDEKRLTPIKKGNLKFDPLAEALIEMKPDATVISTSPLLEHDAMYMKIIYERVLAKKVAKSLKDKKKSESSE